MRFVPVTCYENRRHAGEVLAELLLPYRGDTTLVLAVPRGGIPVAEPIVEALKCEFDLVMGRKIGAPGQPEFAIGAVAEGEEMLVNREWVQRFRLTAEELERRAERERAEIRRRLAAYRGDRSPAQVEGKLVIVVDDGVATGLTIRAVLRSLRRRGPQKLILAVPVAPPQTVAILSAEADEVVCPLQPEFFSAVGQFYHDFSQLTDREIQEQLSRMWQK